MHIVEYAKYLYFDFDLCDLDLQIYREQWDLAYIRCSLPFSWPNYMINVNITEYANFAYFDLEVYDLDIDQRSHDIKYTCILSPSKVYHILNKQVNRPHIHVVAQRLYILTIKKSQKM